MHNFNEQQKIINQHFSLKTVRNAQLAYYSFFHPMTQTNIVFNSPERPTGYILFSRTGIDLFRPYINWYLPPTLEEAAALINQAIPSQTAVLLYISDADYPLVQALFHIQSETNYHLYQMSTISAPEPNVLIQQETGKQNYPRFVIKQPVLNHFSTVASAGLNWQTDQFADMAIYTDPKYRRQGWGKQLVHHLAYYLHQSHRTPLYQVAENNHASMHLINQLPFTDTNHRFWLIEATRK